MMMVVAFAGCGVAMVLALVRAAKGPTPFDRLLAVNAIGTLVILGIALHGFIMGRPEFVDISILSYSSQARGPGFGILHPKSDL